MAERGDVSTEENMSSITLRNILIDSGKTFYESALRLFPRYRIREIDALIITHGHADAMHGMDDLRAWTSKGSIQSHIPIYLNAETMRTVEETFPYLVDKSKATGALRGRSGGEVASFQFSVIENDKPFMIEGLEITPLPGLVSRRITHLIRICPATRLAVHHGIYQNNGDPYWCLGFQFGPVSYISDTNFIPEETAELMRGSEVLILDALREIPHPSHFGINQAVEEARRLHPRRTYLIGWSHENDHFKLENRLRELEDTEDSLWVRPAFDGLRVKIASGGYLREESYFDHEVNGGAETGPVLVRVPYTTHLSQNIPMSASEHPYHGLYYLDRGSHVQDHIAHAYILDADFALQEILLRLDKTSETWFGRNAYPGAYHKPMAKTRMPVSSPRRHHPRSRHSRPRSPASARRARAGVLACRCRAVVGSTAVAVAFVVGPICEENCELSGSRVEIPAHHRANGSGGAEDQVDFLSLNCSGFTLIIYMFMIFMEKEGLPLLIFYPEARCRSSMPSPPTHTIVNHALPAPTVSRTLERYPGTLTSTVASDAVLYSGMGPKHEFTKFIDRLLKLKRALPAAPSGWSAAAESRNAAQDLKEDGEGEDEVEPGNLADVDGEGQEEGNEDEDDEDSCVDVCPLKFYASISFTYEIILTHRPLFHISLGIPIIGLRLGASAYAT
ncbi:beta-lactamase-like protein [Jimgerdemannia flammicorona]|uniref:Beta-lactamase-like protein n=1 Tax=Jimgerdemannia flammicorona TaxID=994334 RepID=A0A433DBH8_9FUNG|nr:beta-lactamase-like protein [Jimgerdemannia flammicorona]